MKPGMMIVMSVVAVMGLHAQTQSFDQIWEASPEFKHYKSLIEKKQITEAMSYKLATRPRYTKEYMRDYLNDFKPQNQAEYTRYIEQLPSHLIEILKTFHIQSKSYIAALDAQQKHQFVKHLYHFIESYKEEDGKTTKRVGYLIKFVPQIAQAPFIPIMRSMATHADTEAAKTPEQKQKEYDDYMAAIKKEIEAIDKRIEANKKEIEIWNRIIKDLNALPF